MKNKLSLSVGITAYNEEANIKNLLNSIISQIAKDYSLLEIIVISDGSTDKTVVKVGEINSTKIRLINSKERRGKSYRINMITKMFKGDVLFLIDADIIINDILLFNKIFKNNNIKNYGLLGINAKPVNAENYFQRILNSGIIASEQISFKWNSGQNYLLYKGCFLCLDKAFAKRLDITPEVINNDAYIYFKALELGYRPVFYKDAQIFYKSPKYFNDYLGQSKRFTTSKKEMEKIFKKDLSDEYNIPLHIQLGTILKNIATNPFIFSNYLAIKLVTMLVRQANIKSAWNIALSTK